MSEYKPWDHRTWPARKSLPCECGSSEAFARIELPQSEYPRLMTIPSVVYAHITGYEHEPNVAGVLCSRCKTWFVFRSDPIGFGSLGEDPSW